MTVMTCEDINRASEIQRAFVSNHMVLFVGTSATEHDITPEIRNLQWSCIITTKTEEEFSTLFVNDERKVLEFSNGELPEILLSRVELPILRIYGVRGEEKENREKDILAQAGYLEEDPKEFNEKYLKILSSKILDCVNQMFVIGYNEQEKGELPGEVLARNIVSVPEHNIQFFGMSEGKNEKLKKLAELKKFAWVKSTLKAILTLVPMDIQNNTLDSEFLQESNIFFKEGGAVSISDMALHKTRRFTTLLTEKIVNGIRPYGRIQQSTYFLNFLTLSSTEGPQWYGYHKESKFYLTRSYEQTMYALIQIMLKGGRILETQDNTAPIVLQGDPGSSKSVVMGALAYRFYEEHHYPVIYIKDEHLSLNAGTEELEQLNILLSDVQKCGNKDIKVLIFWDCSSHRNVLNIAKNLEKELKNRGRRFVLICSSYKNNFMYSEEIQYYQILKNGISHQNVENASSDRTFSFVNGCYCVDSNRIMQEQEKIQLLKNFKEYAGISDKSLAMWWGLLEEEANDDIFTYYYKLISLIRPRLKDSLYKEQQIVGRYVQKQLDRIQLGYKKETEEVKHTIFEIAGIDPKSLGLSELDVENIDEEDDEYDLERFNVCIALFSQFKIRTPYSLAMRMLQKNSNGKESFYSSSNHGLFQVLTTQIPWIRYGLNADGEDFSFVFRNALEAEIFLDENNINVEKQIELICDMLEDYGRDYLNNEYSDEKIKASLQLLLRLIGPNSHLYEGKKEKHQAILSKLDLVLEKLQELRSNYKIPDDDGSFTNLEVTFVREFYGTNVWGNIHSCHNCPEPWTVEPDYHDKGHYEIRLNHLSEAVSLAVKKSEKLENKLSVEQVFIDKKKIWERRNSLVNEMVLCNLEAEKVQTEYLKFCTQNRIEMSENWKTPRFVLPYQDIFKRMQRVIDCDPTNGYYYNTLMRLFEREYQRDDISERLKMQYLSEINIVIDPIDSEDTYEIISRGANGRDELGEHILNIRQMCTDYRFTITEVENRKGKKDEFFVLYDQMLEADNPTAILFVCRQELNTKEIFRQKSPLDDCQRSLCKRVADFMRKEENYRCIEHNALAMSMLIRIIWMSYTGLPLNNSGECNLVYMKCEQWKEIERLCYQYTQCAINNVNPSIMLIYALATLQITQSYEQCDKIIARINENDFFNAKRMRVPYIYCNDKGLPYKYGGKVIHVKEYNGFVNVNGIPSKIRNTTGIKFYMRNLGYTSMPKVGAVLGDLELGIGYMGFSLYNEAGRKIKVED